MIRKNWSELTHLISLLEISSTFKLYFHGSPLSPHVIFHHCIDTSPLFLISVRAWMFHGLNAPLCIAKTRSPSEVAEHQTRASFFDPFPRSLNTIQPSIFFLRDEMAVQPSPTQGAIHQTFLSSLSSSLSLPSFSFRHFFLLPSRLRPFPSTTLFLFPPIHEETVCPLTSFVTRWKRVVTPHRRTKGALSKTYAFALRLRGSTWSRFKWLSANFPLPLFATTLANALILNRILLLQNAASLIWWILILTPFT